MKTAIALSTIAFAIVFSTSGIAAGMAGMDHGSHTAAQGTAAAEAALVDGQVKKVDKASGKVTISHGPLTNLGMNTAMTMAFRVKDASWLDRMKEGDKIRFTADNVNGALTIVYLEAAK